MIELQLINKVKCISNQWGEFLGGKCGVDIDSRTYSSGNMFVCIKGPNFDGFDYVKGPLKNGCKVVVFEESKKSLERCKELVKENSNVCFISVTDTLLFLQQLSSERIIEWKKRGGIVVGITGSNGKTTNKNMLKHIFSELVPGKVHATSGNFNNHIGVPLTILAVSNEHQYLIVEIGSSNFGEIKFLSELARPDYGLISNIGKAHLEFFNDEDGVFKEKRALFDYIIKNSKYKTPFVLNMNDRYLKTVINKSNSNKVITFDISSPLRNRIKNELIDSEYNWQNIIGCSILAQTILKKTEKDIVNAASTFKFSGNRSNWIDINGCAVFMDAYNANPSSMIVAIESFVARCKKNDPTLVNTLLILGDMNELGNYEERYHREVGELLLELGVKQAYFVGRHAAHYQVGFPEGTIFSSTKQLLLEKNEIFKKHKYLFLKGSRTLQLEGLVAKTI